MATWDLVACDGSGAILAPLTRHQGTSLTFTRNGVPECTFTLAHVDSECAAILNAMTIGAGCNYLVDGSSTGMPLLKAYRTGSSGAKVLRFVGYLAAISEESDTDASTATFTFRGPFGRLLGEGPGRGAFLSAVSNFTATDAAQIAKSLLSNADQGLDPLSGTFETTKTRDRSYPAGTNIGEAIVNLTNILDGFDFEGAPEEPVTVDLGGGIRRFFYGVFNVYARMGSDKPGAKFEYGPDTLANCAALHRQTLPPLTVVSVWGDGGIRGFKVDTPGTIRYGAWSASSTASNVSEQQTLDDKAYAQLRPSPVKTISFTPDPALAPSPWDDYWIGDTVRFYARRDALMEGPVSVRVNQVTVAIDPNSGLETDAIPDPLSADEERSIRASLQTEVIT